MQLALSMTSGIGRLCVGIFCIAAMLARTVGAAESDWNLRVWQPNDASPNSMITGLVQSKDGYLWVGNVNSLARFDGIKFDQFPIETIYPTHGESPRITVVGQSQDD